MHLPEPAYTVTDPDGKHKYQIELPSGGTIRELESVTGVLNVINKPALINWATKTACDLIQGRLSCVVGQRIELTEEWINGVVAEGRKRPKAIKDEAANLGTMAHEAFEEIMAGRAPKVPTAIQSAIEEFKKWFDSSNTEIVATELPIASELNRFGGRLDAVGYRNGTWGILDWKTGSGIYGEYALQTAGGYAIAMEEQYPGVKIEWVDIVRFSKKEPWGSEVRPVVALEVARDGFLSALRLSRALKVGLIGQPSYTTFAAVAAEAENLRRESKQKSKEKTSLVGF